MVIGVAAVDVIVIITIIANKQYYGRLVSASKKRPMGHARHYSTDRQTPAAFQSVALCVPLPPSPSYPAPWPGGCCVQSHPPFCTSSVSNLGSVQRPFCRKGLSLTFKTLNTEPACNEVVKQSYKVSFHRKTSGAQLQSNW